MSNHQLQIPPKPQNNSDSTLFLQDFQLQREQNNQNNNEYRAPDHQHQSHHHPHHHHHHHHHHHANNHHLNHQATLQPISQSALPNRQIRSNGVYISRHSTSPSTQSGNNIIQPHPLHQSRQSNYNFSNHHQHHQHHQHQEPLTTIFQATSLNMDRHMYGQSTPLPHTASETDINLNSVDNTNTNNNHHNNPPDSSRTLNTTHNPNDPNNNNNHNSPIILTTPNNGSFALRSPNPQTDDHQDTQSIRSSRSSVHSNIGSHHHHHNHHHHNHHHNPHHHRSRNQSSQQQNNDSLPPHHTRHPPTPTRHVSSTTTLNDTFDDYISVLSNDNQRSERDRNYGPSAALSNHSNNNGLRTSVALSSQMVASRRSNHHSLDHLTPTRQVRIHPPNQLSQHQSSSSQSFNHDAFPHPTPDCPSDQQHLGSFFNSSTIISPQIGIPTPIRPNDRQTPSNELHQPSQQHLQQLPLIPQSHLSPSTMNNSQPPQRLFQSQPQSHPVDDLEQQQVRVAPLPLPPLFQPNQLQATKSQTSSSNSASFGQSGWNNHKRHHSRDDQQHLLHHSQPHFSSQLCDIDPLLSSPATPLTTPALTPRTPALADPKTTTSLNLLPFPQLHSVNQCSDNTVMFVPIPIDPIGLNNSTIVPVSTSLTRIEYNEDDYITPQPLDTNIVSLALSAGRNPTVHNSMINTTNGVGSNSPNDNKNNINHSPFPTKPFQHQPYHAAITALPATNEYKSSFFANDDNLDDNGIEEDDDHEMYRQSFTHSHISFSNNNAFPSSLPYQHQQQQPQLDLGGATIATATTHGGNNTANGQFGTFAALNSSNPTPNSTLFNTQISLCQHQPLQPNPHFLTNHTLSGTTNNSLQDLHQSAFTRSLPNQSLLNHTNDLSLHTAYPSTSNIPSTVAHPPSSSSTQSRALQPINPILQLVDEIYAFSLDAQSSTPALSSSNTTNTTMTNSKNQNCPHLGSAGSMVAANPNTLRPNSTYNNHSTRIGDGSFGRSMLNNNNNNGHAGDGNTNSLSILHRPTSTVTTTPISGAATSSVSVNGGQVPVYRLSALTPTTLIEGHVNSSSTILSMKHQQQPSHQQQYQKHQQQQPQQLSSRPEEHNVGNDNYMGQ